MPRRLRGSVRGAARRALHVALRSAPERTPVARLRVCRGRADAHRLSAPSGALVVRRLAVVGTGLIGASVGLAAKRAGVAEVVGSDPDAETLGVAVERGAIDAATDELDADL